MIELARVVWRPATSLYRVQQGDRLSGAAKRRMIRSTYIAASVKLLVLRSTRPLADIFVLGRGSFMHLLTNFFANFFDRSAHCRTNIAPIDNVSSIGLWSKMVDKKDDEDS